ncbi:MAG: ABC transporter substrate-binding protein [Gammaproteobacteria bacterium]|nr:MAG: ABC transporter substrate-binding protein [Gammaproteobacteria bacterium]
MSCMHKIGLKMISFLALWAVVALPVSGAEEEPSTTPVAVVERTASKLQEKLAGQQKYYAANADELYALVDEVLLPNFDIEYAGKLVLGKSHWLAATEKQRTRFIDAFYSFLIKTYAKGVLEFDQEHLVILPEPNFSKDGRKAMVFTELIIDGGDNIQVNYSVRQTNGRWKIYDVRIEGVSYIQNYRSQFNAEITARGIEAVIKRLELEAALAKAESAPTQST